MAKSEKHLFFNVCSKLHSALQRASKNVIPVSVGGINNRKNYNKSPQNYIPTTFITLPLFFAIFLNLAFQSLETKQLKINLMAKSEKYLFFNICSKLYSALQRASKKC
jgi:hypothetical protein